MSLVYCAYALIFLIVLLLRYSALVPDIGLPYMFLRCLFFLFVGISSEMKFID